MKKSVYENDRYCIQDTTKIFISSKYKLQEILEDEEVPFKLKSFVNKYMLDKYDREDTLETVIYYMSGEDFLIQALKQIKCRIKVNVLVTKKHLNQTITREYSTKTMTPEEITNLSVDEKKEMGLAIQELSV
ncbi:MAG: hypothetical protein K6F84_06820, partial [Lachnospiraceae bacterium]|nr:hypothetical protein [Lachnospiraceae bacterium]